METTVKVKTVADVARKAIELLKDIPAEKWIVGQFTDGVGKCCLIGHYTRLTSKDPKDYSRFNCDDCIKVREERELRTATHIFLRKVHGTYEDGAAVNNTPWVNGYTQEVIKDRCMALLHDMVEKGNEIPYDPSDY